MATPEINPQTPSASGSQTLAQMIRAKYPDQYSDLDDSTLESKVLAKYPQYSDLPRTQVQGLPQRTIGQAQTGVLPWLRNLEGDIRYGTQTTAPGRALHFLGAQGTSVGSQAKAGEMTASPILGSVRAAEGVGELGTSGQRWQGVKDIAGGALQASQIPLSFLGGPGPQKAIPEVAEQAGAAAYKNIPILGRLFASTARAGENFKDVMGAAKDVPVNLDQSQEPLLRLMDWQRKTQLGPTINKFLNRITSPAKGPLNYGEARDWYTLLGRISADEMSKLPPVVQRDLASTVAALKQDVGAAAETVGKGDQYQSAMQEFAQASRNKQAAKTAVTMAAKYALPAGAGAGAAGYIGKKLSQR